MPTSIVPFTHEHEQAVRAFNQRLREAGSDWRFPESTNRDRTDTTESYYFEDFVVVDEGGEVRGGYILKHQDFLIDGKVTPIANYTLPVSEGIIAKKYGMVGVSMILDAQKREAYLFDLGLGSMEAPSARVMKGVGWALQPVPFLFRVLHPTRFCRNLAYLRGSAGRRLALDVLAYSGLGWVGLKALTMVKRRAPVRAQRLRVERVGEFGRWADDVWDAGKRDYRFTAVRDAKTLNALYPPKDERYIRLKVSGPDGPIGWALVLDTQMSNHKQFGAMRLGSIADCFAPVGDAGGVMYCADRFLQQRGVDLIVSNQSHTAWCGALRRIGYLDGPSNFILTSSKRLTELIGSLETVVHEAHFNRGDADGPINL